MTTLGAYKTVQDLVDAGAEILEVVTQDEYTLDIVARVRVDGRMRLAVFDST